MYKTTCPKCGADNLLVVSGGFSAMGMHLCENGFSFSDANQVNTEDEIVKCGDCGYLCPLTELMEG